jgi:hypothetical protein
MKLQRIIHQTLLADERVRNISVPRLLSPGHAVVTTSRLLIFEQWKKPDLWCSLSQPGLSAQISHEMTGDMWSVVVHHPDIYPITGQTYGSNLARDNLEWSFRRRVHADALLDAINGVRNASADSHPSITDQSPVASPPLEPVDQSLTDEEWLRRSEGRFTATADQFYGSPESLAEGGKDRYDHQDFGTAIFYYQKSIDLLHTDYLYMQMKDRQPSLGDAWIVNGYLSALGASLSLHPDAPVNDSVREVTHRLRTISSACERTGATPALYLNALAQLADAAPSVKVDDVLW